MKFGYAGIVALLLLASCRGAGYDPALCENLALKIERHDSITQPEYHDMIVQSEQILKYLVERSSALEELPDDQRYPAYRELLAEPEYMERFSYLFTLGSALYKAEADSVLDESNAEAYRELDSYNTRFAEISDRM